MRCEYQRYEYDCVMNNHEAETISGTLNFMVVQCVNSAAILLVDSKICSSGAHR